MNRLDKTGNKKKARLLGAGLFAVAFGDAMDCACLPSELLGMLWARALGSDQTPGGTMGSHC
jgi:hypothetical protein